MATSTDQITEAIVSAVGKAGPSGSLRAAHGAELLQRMDSLELMIAFADIQGTLGLEFEPEHLLQLFLCQSIEEMVSVISQAAAAGRPGAVSVFTPP
jgi:hypothetical protein